MTAPALEYPFKNIPLPTELVEITNGVYWLRMPLPLPLGHINLYLLEDTDGWWIIDTGMNIGDTQIFWQAIFDNHLHHKPVEGIIVTHMHPDHIGQAGWLCAKCQAPLYMSYSEYYTALALGRISAEEMSESAREHFRNCGLSQDMVEQIQVMLHGMDNIITPIPSTFCRLEEGNDLVIDGKRWRIMIGKGHSPEHVSLVCDELSILIAGDQAIPKMPASIGVLPSEPFGNPLAQWFESLRKFMSLPADYLVLPAHDEPYKGLHIRLQYLIARHEKRLLMLKGACAKPKTVAELAPVMYSKELHSSLLMMAIGECLAHLNYLVAQGEVERLMDLNGVYRYRSIH